MSDISFHVAGGCFGGGHAVFPDALAFPVEPHKSFWQVTLRDELSKSTVSLSGRLVTA